MKVSFTVVEHLNGDNSIDQQIAHVNQSIGFAHPYQCEEGLKLFLLDRDGGLFDEFIEDSCALIVECLVANLLNGREFLPLPDLLVEGLSFFLNY